MMIKQTLKNLSKSALITIVDDLYGRYGDIDDVIEHHIEAVDDQPDEQGVNAGDVFFQSLQRQIAQLTLDDDFIEFHGAYDFSCRLQSLLIDIDSMAEGNPVQALDILENLLNSQESLLNYVDDSDGEVGGALRDGVELWLEIAADLREREPDTKDWLDTVLHFFDNNDYGCFDYVISHSRHLLSEDELRQLAWRFENNAKKALQDNTTDGYNFEAARAGIGLHSVAEALDDMALYEKGTLITSPQPNTLQIEQIVLFAMEINELERAKYWLQQPQWQGDKQRHSYLHNQLLELQGNIEQLKQNLLQSFNSNPTEYTLQAYWQFAGAQERQSISKQVKQRVSTLEDREQAIGLLLMIDAVQPAVQYLLDQHTELTGTYYGALLTWLEVFEGHQQTLAEVICYRLLLTDLLDRGYSKAYHHGARYFHQLLALDKQVKNYESLCNAEDFIRQIQEKHWRKRNFWAEADYPNKPE